jgi:hypothetical protein
MGTVHGSFDTICIIGSFGTPPQSFLDKPFHSEASAFELLDEVSQFGPQAHHGGLRSEIAITPGRRA